MGEPLDYADALARYLHELGLLTYDPHGVFGDCFVESMPPAPDQAVCLSLYGAGATDARNGWDERQLQVRVRGTADPRVSRRRCEALYSALHGLAGVALPGDVWLVLAAANAAPASMGADERGRHEHVVNLRLDIEAPTTHRIP
ncbi:minor capsid protein [Streptomyces sp. NPDC059008]|uniref:minor capsid protein n=1 Tax=Streptomyces sp. NPDC059008 TaxID=3346693 RepID=UPI0036A3FD49